MLNMLVLLAQLKILLNIDRAQQPINRKQQEEELLTIRMSSQVPHNNKLGPQTMPNHQHLTTHQGLLAEIKIKKVVDNLQQQQTTLEQLLSAIIY